jgi:hypothetical protein
VRDGTLKILAERRAHEQEGTAGRERTWLAERVVSKNDTTTDCSQFRYAY